MKKCFLSQKGPKAIGPYSTLTRAGGMCFVSGMLGVNPETGKLAEGVEAQAQQAFTNLRTVLEEIGLTLDAICKTTVFLQDLNGIRINRFRKCCLDCFHGKRNIQISKNSEIKNIPCTSEPQTGFKIISVVFRDSGEFCNKLFRKLI